MTVEITIYAQANPMKLSFDAAGALVRNLSVTGHTPVFDGLTGRMTVATDDRLYHEVLLVLSDAKIPCRDIRAAGRKSFREYFNTRLPLDDERMTVYVTMCQEGRI